MLQKLVASQLTSYLQQHQLLDPLQSAYRIERETETTILKIKADMDAILDDKGSVLLVMLDLSAAFDTLYDAIQLHRLENSVSVKGAAIRWLESYLTGRHQGVHINDTEKFKVRSEVSQGSVREPLLLLFLVCMLPLRHLIERHCISRHGYADDSQLYPRLYLKYPDHAQAAVHRMEQCLVDVKSCMVDNRLKLNDSETEVLVVARKQQRHNVQNIKVKVGDSEIVPSKCVRNLAGVLGEELTMVNQVKSVVKSMNFHTRRLGKVRQYLDKEICARVTSRLDYHNALLTGLHEKHPSLLQVTQNNAARLLTRSNRRDHITPVLQQLYWLPVRSG